jgi:nicotinate-nucleotide adenylyltransferase
LKTVALFGGTFDPVHYGHLRSALELKQRLSLDELRFLPCHQPAHRDLPGATSEQRLKMLQLAVADFNRQRNEQLLVDDREIKRDGVSYSVETLEQCRREMGDQLSLIWVMGTDAFASFDRWHRWQDVLSMAHIVVMARPNESLPTQGPVAQLLKSCQAADSKILHENKAGSIWLASLTPYPVSATAIRQAIVQNQAVNEFLSPVVLDYIQTQQLYR